jgi:peroxiredoxin
MRRNLAFAFAGLLIVAVAAPAGAHGVTGQRAPDVALKDWAQDKGSPAPPKRLSALRGRAVMLGFFACHDPNCVGDVTRFNVAFDTQGPKGLAVIGVAAEDRGEAQGFRLRNQAKYPCVSDAGGKIAKAFGIEKMQSCVLISATGRVLWSGMPRDLATEPLEAACKDAIARFGGERTAALKPVWARIDGRDFGGALKGLSKSESEAANTLRDEVLGFGTDYVALAKKAAAAADHTTAAAMLRECAVWFKGHPPGDAAKALAAEWKADAAVKTALKTESIIDKGKAMELRYDFRSAMALYKKAVKSGGETPAGQRAAALLQHIQEYDLLAVNKSCDDCRSLRAPCEAHSR